MTDQNFIGESLIEQAAKRAKIIKDVRGFFPKINFPSPVLEPMYFGRLEKKPVTKRKLVVDRGTGYQFDIVSDDYVLMHHEEVVQSVLEACPKDFGTPEFKVQMLLNGAKSIVEAAFPKMGSYAVNNSPITPMIRMINSINRSTHLHFEYGAIEQICTNGLVAYRPKGQDKYKHMVGSLNRFEVESQIKDAMIDFEEQHGIWNNWEKVQLEGVEILTAVGDGIFSEPEQARILEIPLLNHNGDQLNKFIREGKATIWTLNSALTQFARHEVSSEKRAHELESQISERLHQRFTL